MDSEVTQLIAALRDGTMSVDQVAQRFRERTWARSRRVEPRTYLELAEAAQEDPAPLVEGSFDEVAAAYYRGDLSRHDYRLLANAAAESMREEDMRKESGT